MTDEIKEILEKLKDKDWYDELDLTGTKWIELKEEETNKILDYITNLQQENKDFKTIIKQYVDIVLHDRKVIDNYKSRCEKAIELYKNCKEEDYCILSLNMYEVLNGSDENDS